RIYTLRLPRRDTEKRCVEPLEVSEKSAPTRGHLSRSVGVRVVPRIHIPSLRWSLRHRIDAPVQETPERLLVRHPTWEAAANAHYCMGLALSVRRAGKASGNSHRPAQHERSVEQVLCNLRGRWVIEGERCRQHFANSSAQCIAQLHRHERVQAKLLEGSVL